MVSRRKEKIEWWIWYRYKHSKGDNFSVMPSVGKLLIWIAKHGSRCCEVEIKRVERW